MAKFSMTSTSGTYMQPNWAAEAIGPQNMVPGGAKVDPSAFSYSDAFTVTCTAAATAASSVNVTVSALAQDIPAGYTLNFGGSKYAKLNSAAAAGATTINVNLAANLSGNETASYPGISGKKLIKAGTFVGRTYTERDAGTAFGPWTSGDEEVYLLAFDVVDAMNNPDCELLRHGTMVRDTLLPDWSSLASGAKTAIRANYECVRGPVTV